MVEVCQFDVSATVVANGPLETWGLDVETEITVRYAAADFMGGEVWE